MKKLVNLAHAVGQGSKGVLRRAGEWLRGIRSRRGRRKSKPAPDRISSHLNAIVARQPGLTCPRCAFRIQITIPALLSGHPIHCTQCLLRLNVDVERSREALQALEKLQTALTHAGAAAR